VFSAVPAAWTWWRRTAQSKPFVVSWPIPVSSFTTYQTEPMEEGRIGHDIEAPTSVEAFRFVLQRDPGFDPETSS
jgi:hypothetical protein